MVPKYPKALVYAEETTEYSLEEIRSRQYLIQPQNSLNVSYCETEQAIQSILDESATATGAIRKSTYKFADVPDTNQLQTRQSPHYQTDYRQSNEIANVYPEHTPSVFAQDQENHMPRNLIGPDLWPRPLHPQPPFTIASSPQRQLNTDNYIPPFTMEDLWRSPNESIYANRSVVQMHPRGSAMKTPIKILSDDDLAETGSRGGLDIAAAAQPADGAIINLDDDTNSSYGDCLPYQENFDVTNTQAFNFNLTAIKVSTPVQERLHAGVVNQVNDESSKRQLFGEQQILSTILEETKSE